MGTIREEIDRLEEEVRGTKYNKATQHHIGKIKAKIAKLREKMEACSGGGGGGGGYEVKKSGNATVSLVGFPSVGKSTLLNKITDADSEVGQYAFTTLEVIPGMMEYKQAEIQILDLPGLIKGASRGKGKGKRVIAAARASDLVCLLIDVFYSKLEVLLRELFYSKIRLNEKRPDIQIIKENYGGINVAFTCDQSHVNEEMIKDMIRSYGFVNAHVIIRSDIRQYQLIDVLTQGVKYLPAFLIINKSDLVSREHSLKIKRKYAHFNPIILSLKEEKGIGKVKEAIFNKLHLIRIYMKPQGGKADMDEPLVIKNGSDIEAVCNTIHRDFVDKFRYARIWGPSSKFPGQKVGLEHKLMDEDIVTIIIQK